MDYEQIRTETRGRVGVIWLHRPEKLNAWTYQMDAEMRDQIERWNADPGIGAVLITGEGRAFCAGADLQWFNRRLAEDPDAGAARSGRDAESWAAFMQRSKPSVVAVNGYAIGVGLTFILPCDVRIAAEDAKLSIRFVRVGLVPELGSTRLLAQIVGLGNATDMCLTGRMVEGPEARTIGLVTEVAPRDQLLDVALAKANELANNPTPVVMLIKDLLARNVLEPDLRNVMEREGMRDRAARKLPSHTEAVQAFLEKREPRFNEA